MGPHTTQELSAAGFRKAYNWMKVVEELEGVLNGFKTPDNAICKTTSIYFLFICFKNSRLSSY
jgi:hypothetical protein